MTDLDEASPACTSEQQKPVGRTGYAKVADERTLSGMSTRQEVEHQEQQATCSRCAYYLPQLAPRVPHHPDLNHHDARTSLILSLHAQPHAFCRKMWLSAQLLARQESWLAHSTP